MNTIERLEELLEAKDQRINQLENDCDEANEEKERFENWLEYRWSIHRELDADPHNLPVPRLQMECTATNDDWHDRTWRYDLVYRHFLGRIEFVPLGMTTSRGGSGKPDLSNVINALPFRDGAHIQHDSATMKLPAYAIVDGESALIEPNEFKQAA